MEHLQGKRSIYVVEEGIKDYGAAAFLRSLGLEVYSLGVADPFVLLEPESNFFDCAFDAEGIAKRITRRELLRRSLKQAKTGFSPSELL